MLEYTLFICFLLSESVGSEGAVPPFPFFEGLNQDVIQEFMALAKNTSLPRNEIEAKEAEWASINNVRSKYDVFVGSVSAAKMKEHSERTQLVNEVNVKLDELEGIDDDKTLTLPELANRTSVFWEKLKNENRKLALFVNYARNLTKTSLMEILKPSSSAGTTAASSVTTTTARNASSTATE